MNRNEEDYRYLAEELNKTLQTLISQDSEMTTFGAGGRGSGHGFILGPRMTENQLTAFEIEYGVTLPGEYRAFLKYVGNGGAGPGYGITPLETAFISDNARYGKRILSMPFEHIYAAGGEPDESAIENIGREAYHRGCLHLTHHGCGTHSFLIVTGNCSGQVWTDCTCEGYGVWPSEFGFNSWYNKWLKHSLLKLFSDMLGIPLRLSS